MSSSGMRESEQHCVKSRSMWLAQAGAQDEKQLAWQVRRRWWRRAMTADRLLFLGSNATNEALEVARELADAFRASANSGLASFPPYCWIRSRGGRRASGATRKRSAKRSRS